MSQQNDYVNIQAHKFIVPSHQTTCIITHINALPLRFTHVLCLGSMGQVAFIRLVCSDYGHFSLCVSKFLYTHIIIIGVGVIFSILRAAFVPYIRNVCLFCCLYTRSNLVKSALPNHLTRFAPTLATWLCLPQFAQRLIYFASPLRSSQRQFIFAAAAVSILANVISLTVLVWVVRPTCLIKELLIICSFSAGALRSGGR